MICESTTFNGNLQSIEKGVEKNILKKNGWFFSKFEHNYKPIDPKSSKNPKPKNMEKSKVSKAYHTGIAENQ